MLVKSFQAGGDSSARNYLAFRLVLSILLIALVTAGIYFEDSQRDSTPSYEWLQSTSPTEQHWTNEQLAITARLLRRWQDPLLIKRIRQRARISPLRYNLEIENGRWFYSVLDTNRNFPIIVWRHGLHGSELRLDEGTPYHFVGELFASPSGRFVAYTSIKGGTDNETGLTLVNVETRHILERLQGTIRSVAWDPKSDGFLYVDFATGRVFHHRLGESELSDIVAFVAPAHCRTITVQQSKSGRNSVVVTKADPASDAIIYFRHGNGIFTKVTRLSDHVKDVWFFGERLLFRSWLHHATYDLFLARQDGKMSGKALGLEIPPGHVLTSVMPFSRTLLVTATFRGNSELFSYRFRDRRTSQVDLPQHVFIYNVTPVDHRDGAIIDLASFQAPPHWDEYRSASPRMIYTGIGSKSGADYSGVIVKDVLVPSSDVRVKIPLTIVQLRSLTVRPSTPTVLTAYGAHGDIEGPRFLGTWLAWLEDGGVLAIAHVRGGGELGESWHTAATLRNKPISSNDLAECARWLAAHGYGSATHLGLIGNSTGAFLVALAITRNPDLYRGAVGESGLYDLLHSGNGDLPFFSNELGDASDNIQRKWLKAESPYLLVRKGIKYPSVFLSYGTNDDVTPPMNTRKLIASLEHSDASAVVLMRAYEGEGHGANIPYSNRVQHRIDELTFLHHVLR